MAWSDAARAAALEMRRRRKAGQAWRSVKLFHGTTDANAARIIKRGILKSPPKLANKDFSVKRQIYLATTRKEAAYWAAFNSGGEGGKVIGVRVPAKYAHLVKPDPNYTFGKFVNKDKKIFSRSIPRSWLKK